jgi:hypothetical protein
MRHKEFARATHVSDEIDSFCQHYMMAEKMLSHQSGRKKDCDAEDIESRLEKKVNARVEKKVKMLSHQSGRVTDEVKDNLILTSNTQARK